MFDIFDPTARERYMSELQNIFDNRESYAKKYPHLVNKMKFLIELKGSESLALETISHTLNLYATTRYSQAVHQGFIKPIDGDVFDRAEAYLKFHTEKPEYISRPCLHRPFTACTENRTDCNGCPVKKYYTREN